MFAVIRTGGKQYRVQEGDILEVEKLNKKEGQKVVFDEVLLIEDGEKILIGAPLIEKAQVRAEVVANFKDEKIIIFKKKRRKQYRRTRGYRQELTRVKVEEIISEAKVPPMKPQVEKKEEGKAPKKRQAEKVAAKKEVKKEEPKAQKAVKAEEKKAKAAKTPTKKQSNTKKASPSKKVTKTKE